MLIPWKGVSGFILIQPLFSVRSINIRISFVFKTYYIFYVVVFLLRALLLDCKCLCIYNFYVFISKLCAKYMQRLCNVYTLFGQTWISTDWNLFEIVNYKYPYLLNIRHFRIGIRKRSDSLNIMILIMKIQITSRLMLTRNRPDTIVLELSILTSSNTDSRIIRYPFYTHSYYALLNYQRFSKIFPKSFGLRLLLII